MSIHTDKDYKVFDLISQINPYLKYAPTEDDYDPVDFLAIEEDLDGEDYFISALFEVKIRSADKCKYVRKAKTLLVDAQKVDRMIELAWEENCKTFLAQYLEDKGELTLFKVADGSWTNPRMKRVKIKANKNTRWNGEKVEKEMVEYPLSDCFFYQGDF